MKPKKIIKRGLEIVGLGNLRFLWEFPRPSTVFAKKHFKNKAITCAEIGVWSGKNSRSMMKTLNVKKIFLVDPYKNYGDYERSTKEHQKFDSVHVGQKAYEDEAYDVFGQARIDAEFRMQEFSGRCIWIIETSDDAVKEIPELDFIYIDGNHEYEYIKRDIENYFKKIKSGGILAGHDVTSQVFRGVIKAFVEFIKDNPEVKEYYVGGDDWWMVKK